MMKRASRFSRVLSFIMVLALVLSMVPASVFAADTVSLYLKPNSNWVQSDAWFAVYYWDNSGSHWAKMTQSATDGVYEAEIPSGYTNVIFTRMNPAKTALGWDSKWDQTKDQTFDGTKNLFTVNAGQWNNATGTWSVYVPPVTNYSVTTNLVNLYSSNTAATVEEGTAYSTTLTAVKAYALPQSVTVTVGGTELTSGYSYSSETGVLTIEAASVTGDIVITAVADALTYLKPNANWNVDNARFAAYLFNGTGNTWVDLTDKDGDGYYEVVLPAGYDKVIFCRMNPNASANDWNNKWNQTGDLNIRPDGKNLYTVPDGAWDGSNNDHWSVYPPEDVEEPSDPTDPSEPENPTQPSEPEEPTASYFVAGDKALCGVEWSNNAPANKMEHIGDGIYQKVYTNVAAGTYNLKVTDGTWDNAWGDNGQNYTFVVKAACDVTVTFDSNKKTVSVTGDSVGKETGLTVKAMYAVGNGSGNWLNGASWNPAAAANAMTEVAPNVYEITFKDVAKGSAYEFKFAANGTWTHSWGKGGTTGEAAYNGQNIKLTVPYDKADVTLKLDMTGYNHSSKTGAKYTVTVTEAVEAPAAKEYFLYGYINGADVAGNELKFVDGKLTVTFTAADNYIFVKDADGASYMTNGWLGFGVTSATLGTSYASGDKLHVAAGEYELTLTENADGTLGLSVAKVEEEPAAEYYLYGYINGADVAGNELKFVDGKLTVTFTAADNYIFVKDADGASYMTNGWLGFGVTSATLGTSYASGDKLHVAAGEYELTLTENADGTLGLSVAKVEGEEPEVLDYYLVGYINGADYGIEGDAANLGEYKFVDGKLSVKFNELSYVVVKDSKGTLYGAESYCQDTTVTLKNGNREKMMVPGATDLTFTLVVNEDGTLTLSYSTVVFVPEIPEGSNVVTVHFLKPSTWGGTVNAWVWDANGAIPGYELYQTAWPGSPIPGNADKAGWYDLVIGTAEPQAFNFIFNDGSSQTPDLTTGEITGPTELWVVGDTVYTSAPLEWTHFTVTIHYQKPDNWGSNINAYAWNDGGNLLGEWPGTVASTSLNAGWYTSNIHVKVGEQLNVIFNDGSNQTADITLGKITSNMELWLDGSGNKTSAPDNWVDVNRTVHVPGSFPGPAWDATSNQMTYDPALGLYVITFKNVTAGTYEYKIAISGSWAENYGAGGVKDGSNIRVVVPTKQDVTIWYSDVSHRSVCSVDYDINTVVALTGTGIPEGTKMTDPSLTGLFTATVKLAPGTYKDVTITFGDHTHTFGEFTLENEKEVTFYFDPSTYLAYHNASDVKVETDKIFYNTKDLEFKDPFGAVATGKEVTFAIETGVDATQVSLIVKGRKGIAMEKDGEPVDGVQRWKCTTKFDSVGEYQYYFAITNGSEMVFYTDDNYNDYYRKGDYGTGTIRDINNIFPYDLVVYYDGFTTPDWMKNAVIYQIFPDRFFDANPNNNQAQTTARGEVDYEYVSDWYLLPENPEQPNAPTYVYKGDGEWSNEIYGGDLDGITERIGYLKSLGVTVIYLNPVFSSISNHRYDACDYTEIDPILGTLGDFEELVAAADANGMKIVLDGVFNHVSDDSVYFDRYYKFLGTSEKVGAYPYWAYVYDYMAENKADQQTAELEAKKFFETNYGITDFSYTEWFKVENRTTTSVDKIGLRAGKNVYSYEGWWGYDSMPVIYSTYGSEYQTGNWAEEIIGNAEGSSVTQYWISKGNDGWRLDVANEVSDETWINFRASVKAMNSDAVIIGEIWADSTHYLMGNMYDSVMNYVFRDAVAGFARGYQINRDNKSQMWDTDYTAEDAITTLEILRERYPEEAFYAMMNLVSSHDTSRILSYLDDVEDDRYQKDMNSAFPLYSTTSAEAKQLQYVVSFIQFTYAGAPTIYYGDEIGMVGGDDPDDRRAMEWGRGNKELVEWYAKLAAIRAQYPALRTGSVDAFAPSRDVMGYVRSDSTDTLIVLANRAGSAASITLDLAELGLINENAKADVVLTDLITGASYTASEGKVTVSVDAYRGVILAQNVKGYAVNLGGLAPAYDPAYTVPARSDTAPDMNYTTQDGQTVTIGETLSFGVDALVNTFVEVKINGETVDRDQYDVTTGTTITLSAELIEALGEGEHSISIVFEGGAANAKFTVVKEDVEDPSDPTDPSDPSDPTDPSDPSDPTDPTNPSVPGTGDNVPTGDTSGIEIWIAVMVVALVAIVAFVLFTLKKKKA